MKVTSEMLGNLHGSVRQIERSGIRIRNFAGLTLYEELNPFLLAENLGMKVINITSVPNLSAKNVQTLLINKAMEWSGASSGVLDDGSVLIVLNPSQSRLRQRATLMEEICHVLLGHQRDSLSLDQKGRTYHSNQESEAYAVGAAALLPYVALKKYRAQGLSDTDIASLFKVSRSLVNYRFKITSLES